MPLGLLCSISTGHVFLKFVHDLSHSVRPYPTPWGCTQCGHVKQRRDDCRWSTGNRKWIKWPGWLDEHMNPAWFKPKGSFQRMKCNSNVATNWTAKKEGDWSGVDNLLFLLLWVWLYHQKNSRWLRCKFWSIPLLRFFGGWWVLNLNGTLQGPEKHCKTEPTSAMKRLRNYPKLGICHASSTRGQIHINLNSIMTDDDSIIYIYIYNYSDYSICLWNICITIT